MPEIPASEYLNSLLVAYQNAEKIYSQAVSDVAAAEIRRDEAKIIRDEAMSRLEEARGKYSTNSNTHSTSRNTTDNTSHGGSAAPEQANLARRNSQGGARKKSVQKQSSRKSLGNKAESNPGKRATKKHSSNTDKTEPAMASPTPTSSRQSISPDDILVSPTAGMKKVPKIFTATGESNKRKSSRIGSLTPLEGPTRVLSVATGRTRDWYDKNFDCEACGLVKKFYQATFGTKTHEKTHKVTVRTIVLNDEWNDLVENTGQIQEFYIGKGNDTDSKPTLRDRAAEALVNPPQEDPVALFFAPKKSLGTSEIYYGGSWKVVDGKMLNPPRAVKGQPRQCLARFTFEGVDRRIIAALNK